MYQVHNLHGYKIYLNENESPMMKARVKSSYEPLKFKWLKSNLTHNDVFVDVGANKGDFTLLAALYCNKVYSVEPHPENLKWLTESISLNDFNNVEVLAGCATNNAGTVELGVGSMSGHHSITAKRHSHITVDAFRLDEKIKEKSLVVKIDVEGAEKLVLEGMSNIMRNVRAFLIDVDSGDHVGVKNFLSEFDIITHANRELICIRY